MEQVRTGRKKIRVMGICVRAKMVLKTKIAGGQPTEESGQNLMLI